MPTARSTKHTLQIRPYWLLIALTPIIPAVINATRTSLEGLARGRVNWNEILFTFIDWCLLGCFTPFVYFLAHRYPLKKPKLLIGFLAHFFGALGVSIIWAGLGAILGRLLHQFPWPGGGMFKTAVGWTLLTLPYAMLSYVLMLGCVYAFMYYRCL